jgi:hypothetical protein
MNNISTTLHKEPDLPVVDFFNPKKDARLTQRKHLKAKKKEKTEKTSRKNSLKNFSDFRK